MRRITGRKALGDALMSAGSVLILLMVLVAVDDRVRAAVWQKTTAAPSMELVSAGYQVQNIVHVVASAARDQSIEHAPLLIFALAAGVLTLFMLRT
jgi:hypothetical protein